MSVEIYQGKYVVAEDALHYIDLYTINENCKTFRVVANRLWEQKALDWLFMPVDDYGCFDEQVPDYQGMKVFDVNKPVMDLLKEKKITVKSESIKH